MRTYACRNYCVAGRSVCVIIVCKQYLVHLQKQLFLEIETYQWSMLVQFTLDRDVRLLYFYHITSSNTLTIATQNIHLSSCWWLKLCCPLKTYRIISPTQSTCTSVVYVGHCWSSLYICRCVDSIDLLCVVDDEGINTCTQHKQCELCWQCVMCIIGRIEEFLSHYLQIIYI